MASLLSRQGVATDWLNTTGMPDPWYHIGSNWDGGAAPGPNDTAIFDQTAAYEVWWDSTTASTTPDVKFLNVLAGEVTFLNRDDDTPHYFIINGSGGFGSPSDFSISVPLPLRRARSPSPEEVSGCIPASFTQVVLAEES